MSAMIENETANQIEAIAALPTNVAIMRMENDTMQAMAVAHPRNMGQIKKDLLDTLEAFPIMAQSAIYSKPVGTVVDYQCNDCQASFETTWKRNGGYEYCPKCRSTKTAAKGKPRQKFAQGLSIRAAEALRESYGYNRVDCDLEKIDENTYKIIATFTDFQRGSVFRQASIATKRYTSNSGQDTSNSDSRFFGTTIKGEQSKAIREAISRSVSPALKLWFYEECENRQNALLTEDVIDKTIEAFDEFKISQQDLEQLIGRTRKQGWSKADRRMLMSIYTSLRDGETNRDELMAVPTAEDANTPGKQLDKAPSASKPKTKTETTKSEPVNYVSMLSSATTVDKLNSMRELVNKDSLLDLTQKATLLGDIEDRLSALKSE